MEERGLMGLDKVPVSFSDSRSRRFGALGLLRREGNPGAA